MAWLIPAASRPHRGVRDRPSSAGRCGRWPHRSTQARAPIVGRSRCGRPAAVMPRMLNGAVSTTLPARGSLNMPGTARVEITGPNGDRFDEILTPQAIDLIGRLHAELGPRRQELLAARRQRQAEVSRGVLPDFLAETAHIRSDPNWRVADPAPGLVDRRVEITGPTDRRMTINALNSGAKVWLADFEDANTPLWENMIEGQLNLKDAVDRTIDFRTAEGREYALGPDEG